MGNVSGATRTLFRSVRKCITSFDEPMVIETWEEEQEEIEVKDQDPGNAVITDEDANHRNVRNQNSEAEARQKTYSNVFAGNNDANNNYNKEEEEGEVEEIIEPREFQLHRAACDGDVEKLETLLAMSTDDINDRCEYRRTCLMQSVINDRLGCVKVLIRFGCDVNCEDIDGKDAIMLAAEYNKVGCLRYLYKSGLGFLFESPTSKLNVLKVAAKAESYEALKLLIELFPNISPCLEEDITMEDKSKMNKYRNMFDEVIGADGTIFHVAAKNGDIRSLRLLASKGANIHRTHDGVNALMKACNYQQTKPFKKNEIIKVLLDMGISPYDDDSDGDNVFCWAAGIDENMKILMQNGFDVNKQSSVGKSPLISLVDMQEPDSLAFLIECDAKINLMDKDGRTALHWVEHNEYESENHTLCLEYLLKNKADLYQRDLYGRHALMYAFMNGHADCARQMIKSLKDAVEKVDDQKKEKKLKRFIKKLSKQDRYGLTMLHHAVVGESEECIDIAMELAPDDIHKTDMNHISPLLLAVKLSLHETADKILERGASVNARDSMGRSPLFWAAWYRDNRLINQLHTFGANINSTDKHGVTPLMISSAPDSTRSGRKTNPTLRSCISPFIYEDISFDTHPGLDTVKLLLKLGSSVKSTDIHGTNILIEDMACLEMNHLLFVAGCKLVTSDEYLRALVSINSEDDDIIAQTDCTLSSLMELGRECVRSHLMSQNTNSNLFKLVPQLPLPTAIKNYLLFDISLG